MTGPSEKSCCLAAALMTFEDANALCEASALLGSLTWGCTRPAGRKAGQLLAAGLALTIEKGQSFFVICWSIIGKDVWAIFLIM